MIVLIAGMPRSGSTFSFNVAREMLSVRGSVYQETCEDVVGVVGRSGGADHVLVKNHNLDEASLALARAGAMRVIMTVRRVEDAMASWLDAFDTLPEPIALGVMHAGLPISAIENEGAGIPYEQIDLRPWLAVWRIASAICPIVYPSEVLAITLRLSKATVKRTDGQAAHRGARCFRCRLLALRHVRHSFIAGMFRFEIAPRRAAATARTAQNDPRNARCCHCGCWSAARRLTCP